MKSKNGKMEMRDSERLEVMDFDAFQRRRDQPSADGEHMHFRDVWTGIV